MIITCEVIDVETLQSIENIAATGTRTADRGARSAGGARHAAEGTSAAAGAVRRAAASGAGDHQNDDRKTNDQNTAHQSLSHRFHLLCGFNMFGTSDAILCAASLCLRLQDSTSAAALQRTQVRVGDAHFRKNGKIAADNPASLRRGGSAALTASGSDGIIIVSVCRQGTEACGNRF